MTLRKAKYRSGILTAGATSIIFAASAMAGKDAPGFSALDKDDDGRLVSAELEPLASHHQRQSESILNIYDQNNDRALSQQEYSQAVGELSSQQQVSQVDNEAQHQGDRIVVEEQPSQVTPEDTVRESEPDEVVQSEAPEVVAQDQQNQDQSQQEQGEQGSGDVFSLSISDLQQAWVHNSQGNTIGGVEDVIVKNDGTDAGVVVRSQSGGDAGQLYYIPANAIAVKNNLLVLDQQKFAEESAKADQFNPQDYNVITDSDRSLKEIINREEVTQR